MAEEQEIFFENSADVHSSLDVSSLVDSSMIRESSSDSSVCTLKISPQTEVHDEHTYPCDAMVDTCDDGASLESNLQFNVAFGSLNENAITSARYSEAPNNSAQEISELKRTHDIELGRLLDRIAELEGKLRTKISENVEIKSRYEENIKQLSSFVLNNCDLQEQLEKARAEAVQATEQLIRMAEQLNDAKLENESLKKQLNEISFSLDRLRAKEMQIGESGKWNSFLLSLFF